MPILLALLLLGLAAPVMAQAPPAQPAPASQQPQDPDQPPTFEETVVVTASRVEQQLVNAPAAVSVVTTQTIENSPATNIGDLLRAVPGINVSQVSARDINITTRGATSTLSTSQLALVDGRSIYLDFYGMVMWDFVPANAHEIKQIEVIRGPASAVWGANAMSGVVNVITKSPRELAADRGTSLTIGAGAFTRSAQGVDRDAGSLFYVNGAHAQAVDDRWAYKLSAGYFTQDPLPRPVGAINNPLNTPYPPYTNTGTSQPKFDARVDYSLMNGGVVTFNGGVSGTEGIIHTGIGPFDIQSGSRLGYFATKWQQGARRVAFFTNILNAAHEGQSPKGLRVAGQGEDRLRGVLLGGEAGRLAGPGHRHDHVDPAMGREPTRRLDHRLLVALRRLRRRAGRPRALEHAPLRLHPLERAVEARGVRRCRRAGRHLRRGFADHVDAGSREGRDHDERQSHPAYAEPSHATTPVPVASPLVEPPRCSCVE